jgi:hypothetical protein
MNVIAFTREVRVLCEPRRMVFSVVLAAILRDAAKTPLLRACFKKKVE